MGATRMIVKGWVGDKMVYPGFYFFFLSVYQVENNLHDMNDAD